MTLGTTTVHQLTFGRLDAGGAGCGSVPCT